MAHDGTLHDMMQSVHGVAKESQRGNDLLREVKDTMGDLLRQPEMNKATLKAIRTKADPPNPKPPLEDTLRTGLM